MLFSKILRAILPDADKLRMPLRQGRQRAFDRLLRCFWHDTHFRAIRRMNARRGSLMVSFSTVAVIGMAEKSRGRGVQVPPLRRARLKRAPQPDGL